MADPTPEQITAQQHAASASAPTFYANRAYVSASNGYARIAIGDQYGPEPYFRAAYLMSLNDAEDLALVILGQVDAARLRDAELRSQGLRPQRKPGGADDVPR